MTRFFSSLYFFAFALTLAGCHSEEATREEILIQTPIGSSMEKVMEFCEMRKYNCKRSNSAGYLNQRTDAVVGVKSIWAGIDEKRIWLVTLTMSAHWGFDKDGRLLDIWIWRTIDAI